MFRSSSEKMAICFTVISDVAFTTWKSISKKDGDLFIKRILKLEQSV